MVDRTLISPFTRSSDRESVNDRMRRIAFIMSLFVDEDELIETFFLLQENGFRILQEDGCRIIWLE